MNKKIQGYVIKTAVYKETNLIVSILTSQGIVSFKAVGALKVPYKLNNLIQLYVYSEYELVTSDDDSRNILIGGKVIKEYKDLYTDFEASVLFSFLAEIIAKENEFVPEFFNIFEFAFNNILKKELYKNIILYMLKKELYRNGSLLESDCCSNCGSKTNIVTMAIQSGGFICNTCNHTFNYPVQSVEYLKGYRFLVKASFIDLDKFVLEKEVYNQLFNEMITFLENSCGIKYNSTKLLRTIFFM